MRILTTIALAVSLAGCGTIANPLTQTRLAQIESSYGIALSAAVAYRDACAKKVIVRAKCAPVVAEMQQADRTAQGALVAARNFVKNNDTINAMTALTAAGTAVNDFLAVQQKYGVQ